jgi:hypothetical protein
MHISTSHVITPITLATQEAEIRRIMVQSQSGEIVIENPSRKNPRFFHKKRSGGVAEGVGR